MRHRKRMSERLVMMAIWGCAAITVTLLLLIIFYILYHGVPYLSFSFITGGYEPSEGRTGILPMIVNTLYMVILTLLISVPVGIATAVYLQEYAKPGRLVSFIRFSSEVLAGIPSIVFGLFGFLLFVSYLGLQYSIIAGAMTLSIMTLPALIRTTEEALKAVPGSYKEGALALGAAKLRILFTILLQSAMPGILTAVVLSIGRIVGESAALLFTSGIVYRMPSGIFSRIFASGRTLTLHVYELAVLGEPLGQTFATASVLLIISLLLNTAARMLAGTFQRGGRRE